MTMASMTQFAEMLYDYRGWIVLVVLFFVVTIWLVRVRIGKKNTTYTSTLRKKYAVIVVAHNEDPEVFERCLASIEEYGQPTQMLVSINDAANTDKALRMIAREYATDIVEQPAMLSYQEQLVTLAEKVRRVGIVIITDPNTSWTPSTANLLQPFANDSVGMASGRLRYNKTRSLIQRVGRWMLDIQQRAILPFQSYYGQAYGLTTGTFAIRLSLLKQLIDDVNNQPIAANHPSSIALGVINQQQQAVYQASAASVVERQINWRWLTERYTGLSRAAYWQLFCRHYQLRHLNFLNKLTHLGFCTVSFVYFGVVIVLVGAAVLGLQTLTKLLGVPALGICGCGFIVLAGIGWLVWQAMRNLPHLHRYGRDAWILPVYLILAGTLAMTAKLWALATVMRRPESAQTGVTRQVLAGLLAIVLLLVTVPLAYVLTLAPAYHPSINETDRTTQLGKAKQSTDKSHASGQSSTRPADSSTNQSGSLPAQTSPTRTMDITFQVGEGDSQSLLARRFIIANERTRSLNPAQQAYVENRLVDAMGRVDIINPGQSFTVTSAQIDAAIAGAIALSAEEQANWSVYVSR